MKDFTKKLVEKNLHSNIFKLIQVLIKSLKNKYV